MVDGSNSAPQWREHKGDILVWPVGAMEQHSSHLPVKTDIMNAEYSAREVAEFFDAALLPVQAVANSLEHGVTRGTFTLRPSTLMLIVRDTAECAERQGFRFLIIVSGHGGNFALGPASREWNREDHKLKILLVQPAEFADASCLETSKQKIADFHAAESETSRFLAMGGKLTGPLPEGPSLTPAGFPWRRQDLNTFGIRRLNPQGFMGMPQWATKEKGEMMLKSSRDNMNAYLADRIEQLRKHPEYSE